MIKLTSMLVLPLVLGFSSLAVAAETTRVFPVKGMHGAADAHKVEHAISHVKGVTAANAGRNRVTVTYDTRKTDTRKLAAAVRHAGHYRISGPGRSLASRQTTARTTSQTAPHAPPASGASAPR